MLKTDEMAEKIASAIGKSGLSLTAIAEACGVSVAAVSEWKRTGRIAKGHLPKLAELTGTTLEWWLTPGADLAAMENLARLMVDDGDTMVYIPVLSVAAGLGPGVSNHVERVDDHHGYSRKWLAKKGFHAPALVRISGNGRSMEPTIFDGDVVLVNTAEKKVTDGRVYAFLVGDVLRIKRLFRQMDGKIRAVSDNPDKQTYPDEFLTPDHMPEMIGRIVDRSGGANL